MANVIKIKRGAEVPTTNAQLAPGEIGFNTTDDSLYMNKGTDITPDIVRVGEDANSILTKIKTVDGASSGLDADLLDGKDASAFALAAHNQAWSTITGVPAYTTRWPTWSEVTGGNTMIGNAGSARKKYSWGGFYSATSSNTGVIRIHVGTSNTMFNAKISLRSYSYLADISVGGYTYTSTGNWHMPQATGRVVGGTLNVRFSGSGENRYIQIGDTNTAWSGYLHVTIDDVSVGYTPDFPSPFTVSLATSYIGTTGSTQTIGELYHTGNMPTTATRWPTWSEVTSKPSTFTPSAHNQSWSTITSKPTIPAATTGTNGENGYYKLDNGIMVQWGSMASTSNLTATAFTFPTAFPSTCYIVVLQPTSHYGTTYRVSVKSRTGATMEHALSNSLAAVATSVTYKWIAIGR